MSAKAVPVKKSKPKQKQDKRSASGENSINDIMKKIVDTHSEADKKLAELATFCFEKDCRVKS